MAEVKRKRRGRPPGSKNRIKEEIPVPVVRSNGIRKRAPRTPRASFLQVSPKYQKLIQKWSNETKIGQQQVLDDILLAGANAAHKSFYRGLINSRKATEALFDAETNTKGVAPKEPVEHNRLFDPENDRANIRSKLGGEQEQPSLAPVGPGYLEEAGADLGEPTRELTEQYLSSLEQNQSVIDAPPTTTEEEEDTGEEEDTESPY